MGKPHDALFKTVFGDPAHARRALRAALPEAIGRAIAWDALTLVPGTFVDSELVEQVSDLLFAAQCDGEPVLIYFVFEHQSTVDLRMPLRLLGYMQRIWSKHGGRLPPIIPVVLHHARPDRGDWSAATSMAELYELGSLAGTGIEDVIPQFRFVLEDLTRQSDEQLALRSLGALVMLVYAALRDTRAKGFPEVLIGLADLIRAVWAAEGVSEATGAVLKYISAVAGIEDRHVLLDAIEAHVGPRIMEDTMDLFETMEKAAEQRGKAEGRAEGKAEGRLEGTRGALLTLLGQKFGAMDAETAKAIGRMDRAELDAALLRCANAQTLDEVVDGGRRAATRR